MGNVFGKRVINPVRGGNSSTLGANGGKRSELIVGVDFTRSNHNNGRHCFNGRCLHDVSGPLNPYMKALSFTAKTLGAYDNDQLIPCYGFGDYSTGKDKVFSFFPQNAPARGLDSLIERYKQIAPLLDMHGPTSFAPLIRQAMKDVYDSGMKFHVLLILADGQIDSGCLEETKKAIVDACAFPLSIVVIGVGDGPWDNMQHFDTELPERKWDNFHFFNCGEVISSNASTEQQRARQHFQSNVLAEFSEHYEKAKKLTGNSSKRRSAQFVKRLPSDLVIDPPTRPH